MPSSKSEQRTCSGGTFDGGTLTTGRDDTLCTEGGGTITTGPKDGGGASDLSPLATSLVRSQMTGAFWKNSQVVGGSTNAEDAERLILFPVCTLVRRFPKSDLLKRLEALNNDHGAEIFRILKGDKDLRSRALQILLELSSIASSALELEQGNKETKLPVVSKKFISQATSLVKVIESATSNDRLLTDLRRLMEAGKELSETRLSQFVEVLGSGR